MTENTSTYIGRSELILRILSYSIPLHIVGFITCTCVSFHLLCLLSSSLPSGRTSFVSIVSAVLLIPGTLSTLCILSPLRIDALKGRPRVRSFEKLTICLVTRGTQEKAVTRSALQMQRLMSFDDRIRPVILTDGEYVLRNFNVPGVELIRVPQKYVAPHAKYKARSLEYFRSHSPSSPEHWVLHLDEETLIDSHTLAACVDFIERAPESNYGQGIIFYNTINYWNNPILTCAELIRMRDDIGRFQLSHNHLSFPWAGVHGAFLLVNSAVEEAVGWDANSLAEDFWFCLKAWQMGFKCGFVPGIAREQSCWTAFDLLRQRRRWFHGIKKLHHRTIAWCNLTIWMGSNLESLLIIFMWLDFIEPPRWLFLWVCAYIGAGYYSIFISCIIQDLDANVPYYKTLYHLIIIPFCLIGVIILQFLAAIYSTVFPPKEWDLVIKK